MASSSGSPMAGASSPKDAPLELQDIGDAPYNEYLCSFLGDAFSDELFGYMPSSGCSGRLARAAPSGQLREALARKLEVPSEGIRLVYEGKSLDDSLTLAENGILEPGPAARKRGQGRISLEFMLTHGVELGAAKRDRQQAADAAEREENERLAAQREATDAAKKAREEAEEAARAKAQEEAAAAALAAAREADRCTLRCRVLDSADGQVHEVNTLVTQTVRELATQICHECGMKADAHHAGGLVLVFGGNPLPAGSTLRELGIQTGSEIFYFWGG